MYTNIESNINYFVKSNKFYSYSIHEYLNGNLLIRFNLNGYTVKVKMNRFIARSGVIKYAVTNMTINSKDSWVKYNVFNILWNVLKTWNVILEFDIEYKSNKSLELTRQQIMKVHYLLEVLYNKSGVLQERKSNQNRKMSSEFQITKIQKYSNNIKHINKYHFNRDTDFNNLNYVEKLYFQNLLIQYQLLWFKD